MIMAPEMISQKHVSFGDLTIADYPIIIGDNPACTAGCPITIGWEPIESYTRNIDVYEFARTGSRLKGRKLILPVKKRSEMLLYAGYTSKEIIDRVLEIDEYKDQRAKTVKSLNVNGLGKFSRNFRSMIKKLSSDRDLKQSIALKKLSSDRDLRQPSARTA